MPSYACSIKTAATAATIDNAISQFWNPANAANAVYVNEVHFFKQTAGAADEPKIRRTSARGTSSAAATPTIENDLDELLAPPSGALIDGTWSVQPTFLGASGTGGDLHSSVLPAAIGSGLMYVFPGRGIRVKGGTGLCLCTGIALAFPVSRVTWVWSE